MLWKCTQSTFHIYKIKYIIDRMIRFIVTVSNYSFNFHICLFLRHKHFTWSSYHFVTHKGSILLAIFFCLFERRFIRRRNYLIRNNYCHYNLHPLYYQTWNIIIKKKPYVFEITFPTWTYNYNKGLTDL